MKALVSLVLMAVAALAQADPSGHWEGSLKVPTGPSKLTLDLARNDHGAWSASMGVPENHAAGLIVSNFKIEGNRIAFDSPDMPTDPAFDLTLREGKLVGTMFIHGKPMPLEMAKTGEAKVEIVPPSPAVSPALAGDWEGGLTLPNGDNRALVFHFVNRPDQTVAATLDTPAQNGFNLSLAGVIQTGNHVEFYVRIHGGTFKGDITPDGLQLIGEWIQTPGAAPIPCKMRKQ